MHPSTTETMLEPGSPPNTPLVPQSVYITTTTIIISLQPNRNCSRFYRLYQEWDCTVSKCCIGSHKQKHGPFDGGGTVVQLQHPLDISALCHVSMMSTIYLSDRPWTTDMMVLSVNNPQTRRPANRSRWLPLRSSARSPPRPIICSCMCYQNCKAKSKWNIRNNNFRWKDVTVLRIRRVASTEYAPSSTSGVSWGVIHNSYMIWESPYSPMDWCSVNNIQRRTDASDTGYVQCLSGSS